LTVSRISGNLGYNIQSDGSACLPSIMSCIAGACEHCPEQPGPAYLPDEADEGPDGEPNHLPREIRTLLSTHIHIHVVY